MRRIQIYMDETLDDALEAEAARQGTSKAALIRSYVAAHLRPLPAPDRDPLAELIGAYDDDSGSVDAVVYGP
ncbi:MAG: CopG family transcriptional regulator [Egibacteraceae bacterium]